MASFITSPYPVFFDTDGTPLENGSIYIGQPNLNPETSPVTVYWDEALTQPAAQPIRTLNGYPSRAGTPSRIYISGTYSSILVRNKKGAQVYYAENSLATSIPEAQKTASFSQETLTATASQTIFNLSISYTINTGSIVVFRNGLALKTGDDYTETNSTRVTLTTGATVGDQFLFITVKNV
jgi:hypothetical protein